MKRYLLILLTVLICFQLCGCDFWMKDTYVSVKPFEVQNEVADDEVITADSYNGVREALEMLIESCVQSAVISVPAIEEDMIDYYMTAAVDYVRKYNPIGAYALNQVRYETGMNAGELAIALDISYNYNRIDILKIKRTPDAEAAAEQVEEALQQYDASLTLYVSDYEESDFIQLVTDYVDKNPQLCMEMPQVTASVYPDSGQERVVVLTFTYRNSREVLRSMQGNVQDVFSQLEVGGSTAWENYASVYAFLMNRQFNAGASPVNQDYTLESSLTPSYSLLVHGVGDSKAFSTVYAAMCRQVGLECDVVLGMHSGEAWFWNVIRDGDTEYYLDILLCAETGNFQVLNSEQIAEYVWDYSAYPSVVIPQVPEETTEPTTEPDDTTAPYDPTGPTSPTNPSEPTDPVNPTDPTDPTIPSDPTDPTEPTAPTEPDPSTEPTEPSAPVKPIDIQI